jgi:hypothetical protein
MYTSWDADDGGQVLHFTRKTSCWADVTVLEEFIQWFRDGGLNLGEEAEEGLRKRIRELYSRYPCDIAKNFCKDLIKEDETKQSDVYLWWGGEPNSDECYALLTLRDRSRGHRHVQIRREGFQKPENNHQHSRGGISTFIDL